jgi:hypothetical protein
MTPNQQQNSFVPTHGAIAQQQLEYLAFCQREFPSLEWNQSERLPGFKSWGDFRFQLRLMLNGHWSCEWRVGHGCLCVMQKEGETIEEAIAEFKLAIGLMSEQLMELAK